MEKSEYDKYVALDCEITTNMHKIKEPTQVAITDMNGNKIFDEYFFLQSKPLTPMSKGRAQKLKSKATRTYNDQARDDILSILRGKIVIGHDLKHDFNALRIDPAKDGLAGVLDSSIIPLFKQNDVSLFPSRGLKNLAEEYLHRRIQGHAIHNALNDAKASANLIRKTFPYLNAPFPITRKTVSASKVIKNYGTKMGIKEAISSLNPHAAEFTPIATIAQPTNVLNFFKPKSTANSNGLLRFQPIKSAENYSKEMELAGLKLGKTANNYANELKVLMNRSRIIDPFANVAKEYGIGVPEDPFANAAKELGIESVKGGNKTRRKKTRRLRHTRHRF